MCFLATFGERDKRFYDLKQMGIFHEILLLPQCVERKRFYRHLFLKRGQLIKISRPVYFQNVVARINNFVLINEIELIIMFTSSEYVEPISGIKKIKDQTDCKMLYLKRKISFLRGQLTIFEKLKMKLALYRTIESEKELTNKYDLITTASPTDRDTLRSLSRNKHERIIDIPNGILPECINYEFKGEEIPNSIAFWGTLDFLPNSTAVHYFYNEIFFKYLRDEGIIWYIIGKNPDDKIIEMGERHKNIIVTGFVDDLYGLVSRIPIMINPMQIGGGIKNKVLEAFALERLVISNKMGMEAINVQKGVHYIHAEDPQDFAEQIITYTKCKYSRLSIGQEARRFVLENFTWEKIGEKYLELVDEVLSGQKRYSKSIRNNTGLRGWRT